VFSQIDFDSNPRRSCMYKRKNPCIGYSICGLCIQGRGIFFLFPKDISWEEMKTLASNGVLLLMETFPRISFLCSGDSFCYGKTCRCQGVRRKKILKKRKRRSLYNIRLFLCRIHSNLRTIRSNAKYVLNC
jgi:hypothetical protein